MMVLVCKPLGTKLTRSACGTRHEAAARAGERRQLGNTKVACSTCATCPVGRAHHAGDRPEHWPDGSPIEVVEIEAASTERIGPPRPTPAKPRSRFERASFDSPTKTPPVPPAEIAARARAVLAERAKIKPVTRTKIEPVPDAVQAEPERVSDEDTQVEQPSTRPARRIVRVVDAGEIKVEPARGRLVEIEGVSRTIPEWAKVAGIHPNAVYERIRRNWPLTLACTAPRGATYEHAIAVAKPKRERLGSSPIEKLPEVDADAPATESAHEPEPEIEKSERGAVVDALSKLFGAVLSPRAVLEAAGFEVVSSGLVHTGTMLIVRRRS
jgi:hypothetical protein